MIVRCDKADEAEILGYIGGDYPLCLYLYLDLKKYGFESETIAVYVQRKGAEIKAVLLKYYSCLHVFSKNNELDSKELGLFIEQNGFSMVYCTAETADAVCGELPETVRQRADVTKGWVAQIKETDKKPRGSAVPAQEKDFEQIVRLIYEDEDIGRAYKYEELAKQLEERNREGYSRNIVIKQGDTVIAHACTNAELDNIAVVAELLVRKEFRRQGYASEIWRDICGRLLSEGKEVYSFYYSAESRALHKKIGFFEKCEWGKIVIAGN